MVTHIDRLSRGLTYGLQVIESLHHAGVEFRSLAEDFDTSMATGKLQLSMALAFSEWCRTSIREGSVAGQAKASYYSAVCSETGKVEWMELEGNNNSGASAALLD